MQVTLQDQVANLSADRRNLVELLTGEKGVDLYDSLSIERRRDGEALPLSFAQQRLWFLDQLSRQSAAYNLPGALRLEGPLHVAALKRSLDEIVRRHEILRTRFTQQDGQPVQVVAGRQPLDCPLVELQLLATPERDRELDRLASQHAQRRFDLSERPLLRVTLVRQNERRHILLISMHHIIADGWSLGLFLRELAALYPAIVAGRPSPLTMLPIQYADYALWIRRSFSDTRRRRQLAYWKRQLAGCCSTLNLPTDRPRSAIPSDRGATSQFHLPESLSIRLRELSRKCDATLFMTLLAAFQTLLIRYTRQRDINIGTVVANRNRSEIENLIGFFANTLVLRTQLPEVLGFRQLLQLVRKNALEAYANQEVPFEHVVESLLPDRDTSHNPLFQVMFVMQQALPVDERIGDLRLSAVHVHNGTAKFDLLLTVEDQQEIACSFEYNADLFNKNTIDRLVGHFRTLLEGIVNGPDDDICALPMLSQSDKHQLLIDWNDTAADVPLHACLHELIRAQVQRTPDAISVVFPACGQRQLEEHQLTYRELNARANQLARYLLSLQLGQEPVIAVCLERSVEMVVGLLGILKAGGAYLPLDPGYPRDRLANMLKDSRTPVVLITRPLLDRLPESNAKVICLDSDWPKIVCHNRDEPPVNVAGDNLAYVIYTSGSTGQPKGAANTHRGICNRLLWMQLAYMLTPSDHVLQKTPFSFDVSVWEFFWPLMVGARIVMARPEGHKDRAYLVDIIAECGVTTVHFVPSMLQVFLEASQLEKCRGLRRVICSGEALSSDLQKRFFAKSSAELNNLYGPTEAAVDVSYWACRRDCQLTTVPIGKPIANTQIYLLDNRLQPVPVGVAGELYIGGMGLARGYYGRRELTAERFVPNPCGHAPGLRLYRTGDLARHLPEGSIDFLGRLDGQVKIRGFRIELAEIESALGQLPHVREAVVIAREDQPGDKRLVAYVVPMQGESLNASKMRRHVAAKLPEYMVPGAFVSMQRFPLSPNGKVSRKELPAPKRDRSESNGSHPPRNPIEVILAGIWADLLDLDGVGVNDNFFELGGHSLLATQAVMRLREALQVDIPLRDVFEFRTVATLSEHIEKVRRDETCDDVAPSIRSMPRSERLPLSFAQRRLWFMYQLEPDSPTYNMCGAVRMRGRLNQQALEQSINSVIVRHESLRTEFTITDNEPVQRIVAARRIHLPVLDLSKLSDPQCETETRRLTQHESLAPFDLSRDPLLRCRLLRLGPDEHILTLTMHHIISDGWSTQILIREIAAFYTALTQQRPPALPTLPVQYADFAQWQVNRMSDEHLVNDVSYWKQQLSDCSFSLELPVDRPRSEGRSYRGAAESIVVRKEMSDAVTQLSRREGTTLFMTLLSVFKTLLHRYSGQDDIHVGTPIAGRTRAEVENLIGFFVNTLVLRSDLSGEPSFREVLRRVRSVCLEAYEHQSLPFDKLVEAVAPQRDSRRHPLFQVWFQIHDNPLSALRLPGLELTPLELETAIAEFDLWMWISERTDGLKVVLEYSTDLFDDGTIRRMLEHFQTILHAVVTDPDQSISELPILADFETRELVTSFNENLEVY